MSFGNGTCPSLSPSPASLAIVDATCDDPATCEYSAAVLVQALRESRRSFDRLTAANLVRLCDKHRHRFRILHADIDQLMEIRYQAEDYLEAQGVLKLTYQDEVAGPLLLEWRNA